MPKFEVTQSIKVRAPIETVYQLVRDMRRRIPWSPWLILEPETEVNFSEDERAYSWNGRLVGSGELKITDEKANQYIDHDLHFFKPWESSATTRYDFQETPDGVEVVWSMKSSLPPYLFFMKKMMVAMIGMDFARGLTMLKDLVETGKVPSILEYPGQHKVGGTHYVGIRSECPISELSAKMEIDFQRLIQWAQESRNTQTGKPFTIYHKWNLPKGTTAFTTAIPVDSEPTRLPEDLLIGKRPEVTTYAVTHTGPYRHLGNAWSSGMIRARGKLFRQYKKIDPFEIYDNNPQGIPEEAIKTSVHFPVK